MRVGFFGSFAALLAVAGFALAQAPVAPAPLALPNPDGKNVGALPPEGACVLAEPCARAARERLWFSAEYLLWWFKDSPLPAPLVTTTSQPDLVPIAAFGQTGTSVLLGNEDLDTGARHGARFTGGLWIDDHETIGVEGSYFFIASHSVTQSVTSDGQPNAPILALPFFDADALTESSFLLASPSVTSGGATLSLTSRLQGAEMNGLVRTTPDGDWDFKVLLGFRFVELHEGLSFTTASTGIQEPGDTSNMGLILNTVDRFDTQNRFYGWQLGAQTEYRLGNLFLNASAKLGLGDMDQKVTVNSLAVTNFFNAPPGGPFTGVPTQTLPGSGVFGQPSNQGRVNRHQIATVSEVGVNLGYQVTPSLRAFIGYDFLYLSDVLRPGNQIDRFINTGQTLQNAIAGGTFASGTRPAVPLTASEFWAQGINFGLGFRY
jgi:hypothetical protein